MISSFRVNTNHFEKTKELIRRYPSFRFKRDPFFSVDSYLFTVEGDVKEFNLFNEIYEKMKEYDWTHKEGCLWSTPLPNEYTEAGFPCFWGCTCGLDTFLIENDLE